MSESAALAPVAPPPTKPRDASADLWIVVSIAVMSLGLFLGRPLNIDDPLFVWTAEQIQRDPLDFYGYEVNWYGYPAPASEIIKNPPLSSYYLAATSLILGTSAFALHLAMLLPNVALVLGVYYLAKGMCREPLFAALAALATPCLLVSATTLMCDTTMLAFWVWTIVVWRMAIARDNATLFLAASVLGAASALTKYFGVAIFPLLAAYTLLTPSRASWKPWLLACLPAAFLISAYGLYTDSAYGRNLLFDAANYAQNQVTVEESLGERLGTGFVYFGGCFFTLVFLAPFLGRWTEWIGLAVFAIAIAVWLASLDSIAGLDAADPRNLAPLVKMHAALFSVAALFALWVAADELLRRRDAQAALIALWILGTFAFALVFNWTINARSLLPLAPPLAIALAWRLERWPKWETMRGWQIGALGAMLLFSIVVAWGDTSLALGDRQAAETIVQRHTRFGEPPAFQGHWGFQYYMQELGARPINFHDDTLAPGQFFVVPLANTNVRLFPPEVAKPVDVVRSSQFFATTLASSGAANFYFSSGRVLLPYFIGATEPDEVIVFESVARIQLQGADQSKAPQ